MFVAVVVVAYVKNTLYTSKVKQIHFNPRHTGAHRLEHITKLHPK
jgi:hypothetical protein